MGFRVIKEAVLGCVIAVLCVNTVNASTIKDVYDIYNLSCSVECPPEVTEVIEAYQRAEKYNTMYQYVEASNYDPKILTGRVEDLKSELQSLEKALLSGCNLTQENIYNLESAYEDCERRLREAEKATESISVTYNIPDIGDVPTEAEYKYALQLKNYCSQYQEIGDLNNIDYPIQEDAYVIEESDTSLLLRTLKNALVTTPLNGAVIASTDDSVTVFCGAGVYVYIGNLSKVIVDKGDVVSQGNVIGKTDGYVLLKLKVGGELRDIRKLFNKGG